MPNLEVPPNTAPWKAFRVCLREMEAMLDRERLNLVDIAKSFQKAAQEMLAGVKDSGMSSLRFEAVVKALDLKTPKSELQRFVG